MKFLILTLTLVALFCSSADARSSSHSRASSRTQASSGSMGHHLGAPNGHYEGVAMASTKREAIRNACYANDPTKRVVSKSVSRGSNGMYYSSVVYRNR